jgi:hypothetical protein
MGKGIEARDASLLKGLSHFPQLKTTLNKYIELLMLGSAPPALLGGVMGVRLGGRAERREWKGWEGLLRLLYITCNQS